MIDGDPSVARAERLLEARETDAARRDLHLAPGAIAAIDRGVALAPGEADEDFEGDPRDAQPAIGADERGASGAAGPRPG